jgi:hypothetical protein
MMNHFQNRYLQAYNQLGHCTPLKFDCGRLCRKNCCQARDDSEGMWLFPGEEVALAGEKNFVIQPTGRRLSNGRTLYWVNCFGECRREARPLACRIFPLTPRLKRDLVTVEIDPRAICICPLAEGRGSLQTEFVRKVGRVCRELAKDPEVFDYLGILTAEIAEFRQVARLLGREL